MLWWKVLSSLNQQLIDLRAVPSLAVLCTIERTELHPAANRRVGSCLHEYLSHFK